MRGRRSTAILLALLAQLVVARPAGAHAFLLRSSPTDPCASIAAARLPSADPRCQYGVILTSAPTEIRLWFSEPVEPFAGGISVRGPSGRAVEQGPARVDHDQLSIAVDATEQGTYLVRWRVVSSDTHPTLGGFAFSVGMASSQPESAQPSRGSLGAVTPLGLLLQVIARWLHFAGYALSFGILGFLLLVLRPLSLAGEGPVRTRLLRLVGWGIVVLVEAELLALLAQSTSLATNGGLDPALLADALESSFGRVLAQRMAAALLLWTLLAAIQHGSIRAGESCPGRGAGRCRWRSQPRRQPRSVLAWASTRCTSSRWESGWAGLSRSSPCGGFPTSPPSGEPSSIGSVRSPGVRYARSR